MSTLIRSYSELRRLNTFEERYDYLRLFGRVGKGTFEFDRWINQGFYRSAEWKRMRNIVIDRDRGNDLGVEGFPIVDRVIIHHMNPMTLEQVEEGNEVILDPEYLITTTHQTHNAIHYGDKTQLVQPNIVRRPGDTIPWRKS